MLTKSADNVGVTFVSMVLGRGVFNNVVNLTLGTFNFTPDETNNKIDPDPCISARLRMDIPCARDLYKALGELFESIDAASPQVPTPTNEGVASGKPN